MYMYWIYIAQRANVQSQEFKTFLLCIGVIGWTRMDRKIGGILMQLIWLAEPRMGVKMAKNRVFSAD